MAGRRRQRTRGALWRHPVTAVVAALALAPPRGAEAAAQCPRGYARSSAVLFQCKGDAGQAQVFLEPQQNTFAFELPAGLKEFRGATVAPGQVKLQLVDKDGEAYKGNEVSQSALASNNVIIFGTLPTPVTLRMISRTNEAMTVKMAFQYAGLEPCPMHDVPIGCIVYDAYAAQHGTRDWSQYTQQEYPTVHSAWVELSMGTPCIPWHRWRTAWVLMMGPTSDDKAWQQAFEFLDADQDECIGEQEFGRAYALMDEEEPAAKEVILRGLESGVPAVWKPTDPVPDVGDTFCIQISSWAAMAKGESPLGFQVLSNRTVMDVDASRKDLAPLREGDALLEVDGAPAPLVHGELVHLLDRGTADHTLLFRRPGVYMVDNSKLKGFNRGLGFRKSANITDALGPDFFAEWGSTVLGFPSKDGKWLQLVEGLWLPFEVNNFTVLVSKGGVPQPKGSAALVPTNVTTTNKTEVKPQETPVVPPVPQQQEEKKKVAGKKEEKKEDKNQAAKDGAVAGPWRCAPEAKRLKTKSECEVKSLDYVNKFTNGDATLAPGCSAGCLCCQRRMLPEERAAQQEVPLAVVGLGTTSASAAQPSGAESNKCPIGYFQKSPVLWECQGGGHSGHFDLKPGVQPRLEVPSGVLDFTLRAKAAGRIGVEVWDHDSKAWLFRADVGQSGFSKGFQGATLVYTLGNDAGGMHTASLNVVGRMPANVEVYLVSTAAQEGGQPVRTDVSSVYRGLQPCPAVPIGCAQLDPAKARAEAVAWSCWLQGQFETPQIAWASLTEPISMLPMTSLPLGQWQTVWNRWPRGASDDESYRHAFAFLDEDFDMQVSQQEFADGYALCTGPAAAAEAEALPTPAAPPAPPVAAQEGSKAPWKPLVTVVVVAALAAGIYFAAAKVRDAESKGPGGQQRELIKERSAEEGALLPKPGQGQGSPISNVPFIPPKGEILNREVNATMPLLRAPGKPRGCDACSGGASWLECVGFRPQGPVPMHTWRCHCGRANYRTDERCPDCGSIRPQAIESVVIRTQVQERKVEHPGYVVRIPPRVEIKQVDVDVPTRIRLNMETGKVEEAPVAPPAPTPVASSPSPSSSPSPVATPSPPSPPPPQEHTREVKAPAPPPPPPPEQAQPPPPPQQEAPRVTAQQRINHLLQEMTTMTPRVEVQEEALKDLRALAAEPGGQDLVVEKVGAEPIVHVMVAHPGSARVQQEACALLQDLVSGREDFQLEVSRCGGAEAIMQAMKRQMGSWEIVSEASKVLQQLSLTEENRRKIGLRGGIDLIGQCMDAHPHVESVQESACFALGNLIFDEEMRHQLAEGRTLESVVKAMRNHPSEPAVQEAACFVLHNTVCTTEYAMRVLHLGGKELILKAMQNHAAIREEVPEARDTLDILDRLPAS